MIAATSLVNERTHHLQEGWGLIPTFLGPPPDAWIDELDDFSSSQQRQGTTYHGFGFSPLERSLPKFELGKFDGAAHDWPDWIGRFKSVVHDQTFLNNNQRLAYLQNAVTRAAKTEIQYLREDGASYSLALRVIKSRFADASKIVRAAISKLNDAPSLRVNDFAGLTKLYQALRSALVTLHRQKFIADILSETNLSMVVEKLPEALATKWTMAVQKHEGQGRPNLFDLDRWLSAQVRCRQYLIQNEATKLQTNSQLNPRRKDASARIATLTTRVNTTAQSHKHTPPSQSSGPQACPCCTQYHLIYKCGEFKEKSIPDRIEMVKNLKLCFNCLKRGHPVRECLSRNRCKVDSCNKHHHSLLHQERRPSERPPNQNEQSTSALSQDLGSSSSVHIGTAVTEPQRTTNRSVYFQIVPVKIEGANGVYTR